MVSELLNAVAPSSTLAEVFVANETVIVDACVRQAKLDGVATTRGGNFGSFTVTKVMASLPMFTADSRALIVALWAVAVAGSKVTGFKF
jgi:hypothetical protein